MQVLDKPWINKYKLAGECRDESNILIGRYIFLWHPDQQEELDAFCKSWIETYQKNPDFFITRDFETQGLDPYTAKPIIASHSWDYNNSLVVQLNNFDLTLYIKAMSLVPRSNHNEKFDSKFDIIHHGFKPKLFIDTYTGAQMGYSGLIKGAKGYALDNLVYQILDEYKVSKSIRMDFIHMIPVEIDGVNYWIKSSDGYEDLNDEHVKYAAQDSILAHQLCGKIYSRLHEEGTLPLWKHVDGPLVSIFTDTEIKGFRVDWDFVQEYYDKQENIVTDLGNKIQEYISKLSKEDFEYVVGKNEAKKDNPRFSPSSYQQVLRAYEKLGKRLKSTNKESLENLRNNLIGNEEYQHIFEFTNLLLSYKTERTLLDKYVKPWATKHCNPVTNRVHPTFKIITSTAEAARMAASDPNVLAVQPEFRPAVIADEGCSLIMRDFSAFEFRAIAGLAGEKSIIDTFIERADLLPKILKLCKEHGEPDPDSYVKAYSKGELDYLDEEEKELCAKFLKTDIHRKNGGAVFGIDTELVTGEQRTISKRLGYTVLYGGLGPRVQSALAEEGYFFTLQECSTFIDMFNGAFLDIAACMKFLKESVLNPGYITTPMGRKKYFSLPPKWHSNYKDKLADAERQAQNALPQGTNGDATKYACVLLEKQFIEDFDEKEKPWVMMAIHDEIICQAYDHTVDYVYDLMGEKMVKAGLLSIKNTCPIEVSGKISKHWTK